MGERLSEGNAAIALLANSLATGFALVALIVAFGPRTGAHLNPVVTAAFAIRKQFPGRAVPAYLVAQVLGAIAGVLIAHASTPAPRNSSTLSVSVTIVAVALLT